MFQDYLGSLERFFAHLDSLTLIWARSGSINFIEFYLNQLGLLKLIWAHLGSLELI